MKRGTIIILIISISIILISGLFSLFVFDTSAKYTNYKEINHYYESNKLYISSQSLIEGTGKYNIINYYNYEELNIDLNNSISETQITNYDINYQLSCNILGDANNYYNCTFENNKDNITGMLAKQGSCLENEKLLPDECAKNNYNYKLNVVTQNHKFKINKLKDNDYKKVEVLINLNTTRPFNKNLQATYVMNIGNNNKNSVFVENVKEGDYFCEYIITNNYNNYKNTKINIDINKLMFDNIENNISYTTTTDGIINSITKKINSYSKEKIILYKKDFNEECNKNDLNISVT